MYRDGIKLFAKNEKKKKRIGNCNTVNIYCDDIRMEFGIEKCAMLKRSWKRPMTEGTEDPN